MRTEKFQWVDIAEVEQPAVGSGHLFEVLRDYWWLVNDKDQVCLYRGRSPQCNLNRQITESLLGRNLAPGAVEVRQLPLVFLRHRCEDYS